MGIFKSQANEKCWKSKNIEQQKANLLLSQQIVVQSVALTIKCLSFEQCCNAILSLYVSHNITDPYVWPLEAVFKVYDQKTTHSHLENFWKAWIYNPSPFFNPELKSNTNDFEVLLPWKLTRKSYRLKLKLLNNASYVLSNY